MNIQEILFRRDRKLNKGHLLSGDIQHLQAAKDKIQNILDTSLLLNSSLQMDQVLELALDTVLGIMQAAAISIILVDFETNELVFEVARGGQGVGKQLQENKFRMKMGEGIVGQVAQSGKPMLVADTTKDERFSQRVDTTFGFTTRSILCVPLTVKGKVIGALEILNKKDGSLFAIEDMDYLMLLGNQIAVAIDNARMYQDLERAKIALEEWNKTLQKRVEERTEELQKAYNDLQKLDQLKSDFLNIVAHDIRSPLTAITGFSEMILQEAATLSPFQLEGVNVISNETKRLNRLIDDLLSFARMESGTLKINSDETDLRKVVEHATSVFAGESKSKSVELETQLAEGNLRVWADEPKLSQVVANLLSNALKYTSSKGKVTAFVERIENEGKPWLKFGVRDTGAGIPEGETELVFEKFKQSSSAETKKTKGTGLGLYICKEFIALHGGHIWAESQYGHGATFCFILPEWIPPS
jgi:signal transduction histidine kinase